MFLVFYFFSLNRIKDCPEKTFYKQSKHQLLENEKIRAVYSKKHAEFSHSQCGKSIGDKVRCDRRKTESFEQLNISSQQLGGA